jgi:hypothetical protein
MRSEVKRLLRESRENFFSSINAASQTEPKTLLSVIIIIIIIIMNYISTRYNFTYTKINYVQDIKRKKGDLPTGRAHTSRNKK